MACVSYDDAFKFILPDAYSYASKTHFKWVFLIWLFMLDLRVKVCNATTHYGYTKDKLINKLLKLNTLEQKLHSKGLSLTPPTGCIRRICSDMLNFLLVTWSLQQKLNFKNYSWLKLLLSSFLHGHKWCNEGHQQWDRVFRVGVGADCSDAENPNLFIEKICIIKINRYQ